MAIDVRWTYLLGKKIHAINFIRIDSSIARERESLLGRVCRLTWLLKHGAAKLEGIHKWNYPSLFKCLVWQNSKVLFRLMKSQRSINLAQGMPCSDVTLLFCLSAWHMNPRRAFERMPHLVGKDYKCNAVLGHWQLSASLGSLLPTSMLNPAIHLSLRSGAERTNCKIHPVPHKQSQWSDGEGTACGIGMLTQAFHIWKEEGGGTHKPGD